MRECLGVYVRVCECMGVCVYYVFKQLTGVFDCVFTKVPNVNFIIISYKVITDKLIRINEFSKQRRSLAR